MTAVLTPSRRCSEHAHRDPGKQLWLTQRALCGDLASIWHIISPIGRVGNHAAMRPMPSIIGISTRPSVSTLLILSVLRYFYSLET